MNNNNSTVNSPMFGPKQDFNDFDTEINEKSIRRGFIRKVYFVLLCQLSFSLTFIIVCMYENNTKNWIMDNPEIMWISLAIAFVTSMVMACNVNVRRQFPMNYIFLATYTVAMSLMLGVISAYAPKNTILFAVGITATVCFCLTLFAFQTQWDFTVCGGFLFVAVIVLFVLGIIAIFFPGQILHLVYASLGAGLFSLFLIYDTQLMMGGEHRYSIDPEEYIFAALSLYLDIVNIFLYIYMILTGSD